MMANESKHVASLDAYDSDVEPPEESDKDRLSWRLDPEESLSDWTIEIVTEFQTETYHVHKNYLAVGPRKSEYFVKVFSQGGRFAESQDGKSRIVLDELAAASFPQLLDYLYCSETGPLLTTENATALHSLAKYFELRRLRWEAKKFCQRDLNADTCGIYYEHARILQDEKILDTAAKSCAENIMSIHKSSRLIRVPDPEFWLGILQNHPNSSTIEFSLHLSKLIAEFCLHNEVELEMFKQLTANNLLPDIHVEAALQLIDAEREIVAPDADTLSSLQKRCIAAFTRDWDSINFLRAKPVMALVQKQNALVLGEILASTLSAAKTDKTNLEMQLAKESQELSGFHRLETTRREIYEDSIAHHKLPETHNHNEYGANVSFNTRSYSYYDRSGENYPLFYFKKP